MKNVDVPLWDKGDSTDSFSKGGSSMFPDFDTDEDKSPIIEKIFDMVLSRKPTSRELSYYRYSVLKKESIINKLLNSQEHKELVSKGREYPILEENERIAKSTILKLKHNIEDISQEHEDLRELLIEKNKMIESLREEKTAPFISGETPNDKYNVYYNSEEDVIKAPKRTFLDKLADFIKKLHL
ncbi:MAG: hypothetical protein PHE21_03600 [Candidatus Dojkabacteria bacterium]|nr:hypothetical protein [Candidatus Dojkabacteria bacterium]